MIDGIAKSIPGAKTSQEVKMSSASEFAASAGSEVRRDAICSVEEIAQSTDEPSRHRIGFLAPRDQNLLTFMLAQAVLRRALGAGPTVELRATADNIRSSLLPTSAVFTVNSGDALQAQTAVRQLAAELSVILIHNTLQFLTETREFLGLCFSKLSVGGMLIISVPSQFLFEREN